MIRRRILLGVVSVLASGALAASATAQQPIPTCRLAQELRQALGFGAREMAALGVNGSAFADIASAALTHIQNNRQTLEPLLDDLRDAKADLFRAYELFDHDTGDETAILAAEQALDTAVNSLAAATSGINTTMTGQLPFALASNQARLASNRGLDASCALLDLTAQQRTVILAAQRERDEVLKHHKLRKNLPRCAIAWGDCGEAIDAVLTAAQRTELQQNGANLRDSLVGLLVVEEAACP